MRVTRSGGKILVLDSPFYHDPASGRAMVAEREAGFAAQFGLVRQVDSISFLTTDELERAAGSLGLRMEIASWDTARIRRLRRAWNAWRRGREQARFPFIILEK